MPARLKMTAETIAMCKIEEAMNALDAEEYSRVVTWMRLRFERTISMGDLPSLEGSEQNVERVNVEPPITVPRQGM